ncbi:MAG: APC family permease [Gammaproteobacteria bacterium]|nr:APC family permease [Gammaproteobacteria bacterium]
MQRSISTGALLLASISAIIGSGWLFTALYTSQLAGPASLYAWLVGGFAVICIAFVFAELCAMLPVMGTISRIPQHTHGTLVSFSFSWIIWLSYTSLMATEVQAVIQYLSYFLPNVVNAHGGLTEEGYVFATFFMLLITFINIYSLRWLIRSNTLLTIIKMFIPVFIAVCILAVFLPTHSVTHPNHATFSPYGLKGIVTAISSGGIVFAFNGFRQACEMAGESKKPQTALPIAIVGSVCVCLAIYLLLQSSFLISLTHSNLKNGWHDLHFPGANSPIAGILMQNRMQWLQPVLYIGAVIGPLAAGLLYAASAGRCLFAMSKNDYMPQFFEIKNKKGIPWPAVIVSFIVGMFLFAPLPGWKNMVSFLASLMAISYAIAPISLICLRHQLPNQHRPLKLPFGDIWATMAFYFCNLLIYWTGWNIISKLGFAILIGFILLFIYHFCTKRGREIQLHLKASVWIWPYLIGILAISYLGNFGGGLGIIKFGWDFAIIAVFSIFIAWTATQFKLDNSAAEAFVESIKHRIATGKGDDANGTTV